jgi:hypothetical protein
MTEGLRAAAEAAGGGVATPVPPATVISPQPPARPGGREGSEAGQPGAGQHPRESPGGEPAGIEPHVRVDARAIESAVLALRKPIVAASLPLDAPGVTEARAERVKLLGQIDDYLLPRLRQSGAPVLVALVGSTGAGKSTLVNSVVGSQVSVTGIRRPTTNSPVLACHPDDVGWFAENVFLPTVPRVRQEGLARSGRDGLLVLAASPGMPKGVALLDTPDIDSVVEAHHEFARQFLDASDLWLFMTTASRYADATVWELLQDARDRGAALGLVLSRIPPSAGPEVVGHFDAMLEANGLGGNPRFLIPETVLADGKLPREVSDPVRKWLADTAAGADRRVAVLTRTMSGVLDSFRARVPALAAQVEAQSALRADLVAAATGAYRAALDEIERVMSDGSLLTGEVLARWQDFAGTGDLFRALQPRRGGTRRGGPGRGRRHRLPPRASLLKLAVRNAVESLITSAADRAAEDAVRRWREHPAGAALLARAASNGSPGAEPGFPGASGLAPGDGAIPPTAISGTLAGNSAGWALAGEAGRALPGELAKSSPELATRVGRAVSTWQDHVTELVRAENVTKRSVARAGSLDDDSLATVLIVGMLASGAGPGAGAGAGPGAGASPGAAAGAGVSPGAGAGAGPDPGGPGLGEEAATIPHRLLASLFGAEPLRTVVAQARAGLRQRARLILDEEALRFTAAVDAVGVPDPALALRLYQATYALEVAR